MPGLIQTGNKRRHKSITDEHIEFEVQTNYQILTMAEMIKPYNKQSTHITACTEATFPFSMHLDCPTMRL